MEEAGGTPASQHSGSPLVVIGVLLVVALVGLVAWVTGGDDVLQTVERAGGRFPEPTTTAVSTIPTATTVPGTPPPTPPTEAPTTAQPPGAPPALAGPSVAELVPSLAALAEPLTTPEAVRAQLDQLLAAPRHDVASSGEVAALCAVVPVDGPIVVAGRWERDGRRVSSSAASERDAPGFGECVGNDGEPLDDGSYQYIAVGADGLESAAGGFVVGAARVEQRFTNNGDDPVCGVRIAPTTSRYFEVYVFDDEPVMPDATVTVPVAAVDQDVEAMSCRKGEVLATFEFLPDAEREQELLP